MMWFPDNFVSDFLNVVIVSNRFVFLDVYSFGHVIAGVIFGVIAFFEDWKRVFCYLLAWELFEIFLKNVLFRGDSFLNMGWDLGLGMVTFLLIAISSSIKCRLVRLARKIRKLYI